MSGVMDCRSPSRMKLLIVFLLVSTNIVCLHGNPITGANHSLHCVTDYLYTVNCSLSIAPSDNCSDSNSSYWLTFVETYEKTKFVCMLTNTNGNYFCSFKKVDSIPDDCQLTFDDLDMYEISLCHNQNDGSENCEQLDQKYEPVKNIKPNAPCCLTVRHNSSKRHFTWRSTYEKCLYSGLMHNLKYQLHFYTRGDKHNVLWHEINTNSVNYSVDDHNFVPNTKYAARVRTSPNLVHYEGQWSDWSLEVYWETEPAVNDLPTNTFFSGLGKVLIPLFVVVPFTLIFCYAPVKKWRQGTFIPTPAPYFHTLYNDCQGDFKSWVVTHEHTADMLKAEETLKIDTLTKCAVVEEEECQPQVLHHFMEGSTYSNITDPGCDASLLGIPYAVSTMEPASQPGSSSGSPAEEDSGCWLERDPPWYCNEYCTLSAFQQGSPVTAEHYGSPKTQTCPTGIIRVE